MKYFIVFLLNIFFLCTFAENTYTVNDSSNTTVITFSDIKSDPIKRNKKGKIINSLPKNSVKIGLLGPVFGEVPIYYERYITDWFTIQAGVGITFRDFFGDFYTADALTFGKSKHNKYNNWNELYEVDLLDENQSGTPRYQTRKAGVGFCASFAPRFFPGFSSTIYNNGNSTSAFDEGMYLSPFVQYSIRNYKAQKVDIDGNYLENEKMKEKTSSLMFLLVLGYEKNFVPVMLDCYVGFGFVRSSNSRLDIGYTLDEINYTEIYENKEKKYTSLNMYIKIGLDLGLTFGGKKKKKQSKL